MPLLLHIDTATEHAGVCLSRDGIVIGIRENTTLQQHASFLQPAIRDISKETGISLHQLDAVCVTAGPGSYTGLRVGLSSAKGLCYALNKPLILLGTLEVMAYASIRAGAAGNLLPNTLFCPMIDARRMEVFTAAYDSRLQAVLAPGPMVLTTSSFDALAATHHLVFSGSGSRKFQELAHFMLPSFPNIQHHASDMIMLAEQAYAGRKFADLAYSEPFYMKEFFTPVPPAERSRQL